MPWSPLKYTEQIFERLKKMGHVDKTTTNSLHVAIMKETLLIREKTIANVIKAFERMGYIINSPETPEIWEIKYWEKMELEKI